MTNRSSSHRWVYFFIQNGFAANASILSYFKGSWGTGPVSTANWCSVQHHSRNTGDDVMGYFVLVVIIAIVGFAAWKLFHAIAIAAEKSKSDSSVPAALRSGAAYATPILVVLVTILSMFHQVPAGHVGIVYTFGGITGQRGDGLQWVAPWQDLHNASVQVQGHKFPKLASFSSETQDVYVDATINVQVSPQQIQELYRDVGPNYFDILVRPRVLQAFKDETVKYSSVNIAPNREAIRKTVRERLTKELSVHSISVQDLLVDNISFSSKFQNAIEEKQSQSQLALSEKEKVAGERDRKST